MRASPGQRAFSSGEISPLLHDRPGYTRHKTGLEAAAGFLPLRQGPLTRQPGTLHRGSTDGNAQCVLVPFVFAENDAVVLEFTNLKMRVWRYGALVLDGPSPYELVTPYDLAALGRMQFVQSADVIYMVDGQLPVQRLARLALDNWTIGDASFTNGPFAAGNTDKALTITPSAETGSVTLTASGNVFEAGHVGGLFMLQTLDDDVPGWAGGAGVSLGERVRYDGQIYELVSGNNTGENPPIHAEGEIAYGGTGDPVWRYLSDDLGIVQIDTVSSPTSATATVVKRIPPGVASNGTYVWAEGAWSTKNGYPSAIEIHDQRHVLAATPAEPRTVWFSTAGDLLDFQPGTLDDSAFAYTIGGNRSVNQVLWLLSGARGLHIGALGEEYSSRSTVESQSLGPRTARFLTDATIGSKAAQPIAPDGRPVFISRDGRRVFELRYQFSEDSNAPIEMSLPAEHLGVAGFEQIEWQSAPLRQAWLRRANGELAVLVHEPAEEVLGWAPLPVADGFVETMCVTPAADGSRDILTLCVRREIDGQTVRYIEDLAPIYGIAAAGTDIADAVHLFASAQGTFADPGNATITGLDHLEGEEVFVWTDLGELGPLTVSGGQITVEQPVTKYVVGLFDASHRGVTLDPVTEAPDGSTLGRNKRLVSAAISIRNTVDLELVTIQREAGEPDIYGKPLRLSDRAVPSDLVSGYAGKLQLPLTTGMADQVHVEFRPVGGAPATLTGFTPNTDIGGV